MQGLPLEVLSTLWELKWLRLRLGLWLRSSRVQSPALACLCFINSCKGRMEQEWEIRGPNQRTNWHVMGLSSWAKHGSITICKAVLDAAIAHAGLKIQGYTFSGQLRLTYSIQGVLTCCASTNYSREGCFGAISLKPFFALPESP